MILPSGTAIGPYSITREVGRGGMGIVYLAHDTRLDRDVAIKALPEDFAADPARFEREARTLAQLSHPNLAMLTQQREHVFSFHPSPVSLIRRSGPVLPTLSLLGCHVQATA